jgi:hypothetical protein
MELEATWERAIRIWWALLWRIFVIGNIGSLVIVFVVLISGQRSEQQAVLSSTVLGLVWGSALGLYFVRWMLNRDFGDFRLALVSKAGDVAGSHEIPTS